MHWCHSNLPLSFARCVASSQIPSSQSELRAPPKRTGRAAATILPTRTTDIGPWTTQCSEQPALPSVVPCFCRSHCLLSLAWLSPSCRPQIPSLRRFASFTQPTPPRRQQQSSQRARSSRTCSCSPTTPIGSRRIRQAWAGNTRKTAAVAVGARPPPLLQRRPPRRFNPIQSCSMCMSPRSRRRWAWCTTQASCCMTPSTCTPPGKRPWRASWSTVHVRAAIPNGCSRKAFDWAKQARAGKNAAHSLRNSRTAGNGEEMHTTS